MLTKSHVLDGAESRSSQFYADPLVPLAYRVVPDDYTGSGYDRGHLCPAADMSWSAEAMHDSFYMSNMCPQEPSLNRVSWKALETACRKWVITEDTLYIVAGPVYLRAPFKTIGRNHTIHVPSGFFKVILSLRKGHEKAIGFFYSNSALKQPLSSTAHSVDEIENLTGLDFFKELDNNLENTLERQYNLNDWK